MNPISDTFFDFNAFISEALSPGTQSSGGGGDLYEVLLHELDSGWPWPLDSIQGFLESLYNIVVSMPRRVWDYFQDAFKNALVWLQNNLVLPLWRYVRDVYLIVQEWTAEWASPWREIGQFLLFPAAFTYKFLKDSILPALESGFNAVKQWFDGAVGGVFDAIRNAFSPIFDPLMKFADAVWRFLTETIPDWLRQAADFFVNLPKTIVDALQGLANTIVNGIKGALEGLASSIRAFFSETIPKALEDFANRLWDGLVKVIGVLWNWLQENVVPPIRSALGALWDAISGLVRGLIDAFNTYINRIKGHAEKGDVIGILLEFLPLAAATMGIAAAVDLASIKVGGTGVDPQLIRQQVGKLLDALFDPKLFTSVFAAIAFQKPLEYAAKFAFRPEVPPPADLLKFYALNTIDKETLKYYLGRHGYSDYWTDRYEYSVWQLPQFSAVFTAYKRGVIDESDYYAWLNILNIFTTPRPGFKTPDVKVFEESMYRMPSPFVLAYAADTGLLTIEDIKKVLEFELIHPQFVELTARALYERSLRDEKALIRSQAISLFTEGVLTEGELYAILKELNIAEEFIPKILDLLGLARERRIRTKVLGYLERAFLDGYISREDFVSQLTGLGVDRELAHRYAILLDYVRSNYYMVKETKDERTRYASLIEDMVAKGAMSEEEARRQLVGLGFTDAEVELRLRKAMLAYNNENMRIRLNDLIERVKQGLVDRRTFEDECVRIGYSAQRCREWGQYYWSKYIGADFLVITRDERNALANSLTRLYVMGFLTEDQLREELRRLGFMDIEIDLRIKRAETEDRLKLLSDLLAEADAMLRKGQITPEEYVEYLVSLGMRPERAQARARRIGRK